LVIYVQNVGQGSVKLLDIYVNGIKFDSATKVYPNGDTVLKEGKTATCTVAGFFDGSVGHRLTDQLKIRAVTEDGTFTEATITIS
jgi:hypothetical protein